MSNRHEIWYETGKVVVYIYAGFDVCARRVEISTAFKTQRMDQCV